MAVPASGPVRDKPDWAYISSGTWSLLGAEVSSPVITQACQNHNFTNEGGVGGSIRLLKNITGLWLLQECRRIWSRDGKSYAWDELMQLSNGAPAWRSFIHPDAADFVAPADMPEAIRDFCRRSHQEVPDSPGAVIRCVLESLAIRCRLVLEMLESVIGTRISHCGWGSSEFPALPDDRRCVQLPGTGWSH
jgi:rhamnulokinase